MSLLYAIGREEKQSYLLDCMFSTPGSHGLLAPVPRIFPAWNEDSQNKPIASLDTTIAQAVASPVRFHCLRIV